MTRFFLGLSRLFALMGGIMLTIVIMITSISILGRSLNSLLHSDFFQSALGGLSNWLIDAGIGSIKGDFELVEAAMAFSIFAFIPLTQMTNGHAAVDLFTAWLPKRAQLVLRMLIEILFAVVLVIIAKQLFEGMSSKMRSGQTTFLLEFKVWWAYALSLVPAVVAATVGIYMALVRTYEAAVGRVIIADEMGAEH